MALSSPGVEVQIIDQSQYLPAATGSVPLVVFATAQDKTLPSGVGIAPGTTAANAGKLFQITSQRDLVQTYGTPKFYTTADGTPIQGDELNEYGLLAAYSALNVSNRCYALRADIDLASLVGSAGRPSGEPENGAYWLDTTTSTWGIYEWDAIKQVFVPRTPIVITDSANTDGNDHPLPSIGNIGDYAIVLIDSDGGPQYSDPHNNSDVYYKLSNNEWVGVGEQLWTQNIPAIVGTESDPTLTAGDEFTILLGGASVTNQAQATIAVPSLDPTANGVADEINNLGWLGISASVDSSGRLQIFLAQKSSNALFTITQSSGSTVLDDLGITSGNYNQPAVFWGPAASAPLWGTGQIRPRPSGSVWMKVGAAGAGSVPVMKMWDAVSGSWVAKNVPMYIDDASAINALDATGGKAIPAGTIYAQYFFNGQDISSPIYFWRRMAAGPTVVTGTNTSPSFTAGPYSFTVQITTPNSASWTSPYTVTLADNSDATDFVTAWQAAQIPYTTAVVTTEGSIQLTHTAGGSIDINDINSTTGLSSGLLNEAGFIASETTGCKYGFFIQTTFNGVSPTGGTGSGVQLTVLNATEYYNLFDIDAAGTGYTVGDVLTVDGADLGGTTGSDDLIATVTAVNGSGGVTSVTLSADSQYPAAAFSVMLSSFDQFVYTPNEGAPTELPDQLQNWYYEVADQVDIMVNTQSGWKGYRNANFNSNGFPLPSGVNSTDPNGPICAADAPTVQSDGTALAYGDLWIDTNDLENYPMIYRWQQVDGEDKWVLVDTTDDQSGSGLVFADARWSSNQNLINPANDPIPTIKSLLTSNNIDIDCPSNTAYPVGILLFNTRRSGYNVKQWNNNYFTPTNFPDMAPYPTITGTWVSASGLKADGVAYMGRQAQRNMVVTALKSVIDTNTAIRDEDNFFNLMATPAYPEVQQNMVVLNVARGETTYILGDTPMRLPANATDIQAWANTQASSGGPFRNTYLGLFYPSGLATDLSGNQVVVPPSHMMLFTFLYNDTVAYPWFAAAGTRRGLIQNALGIGYIDSATGEFQETKTPLGLRDTLYTNFINPLVFFTGNGLLNYGNKTSFNSQSALDRTNVARLVAYVRRQLTIAARPFVFEPNDALTRQQISGVVESLMVDLVAKRGIYDYVVVCDESNNTPARIDRNELWIDVALEPVKAAEFIYIPVRILNTGELSGA